MNLLGEIDTGTNEHPKTFWFYSVSCWKFRSISEEDYQAFYKYMRKYNFPKLLIAEEIY